MSLLLCLNIFLFRAGSDLVEWLYSHVEGFADRRDAKKYANNLLKAGYIRHTVNKITFSEQCYYVFGDLGQRAYYTSSTTSRESLRSRVCRVLRTCNLFLQRPPFNSTTVLTCSATLPII